MSRRALLRTDETDKAASMLTETLKDPDWGHSYSPGHAPFNFWSKYPGSIFLWYEDAVCVAFVEICVLTTRVPFSRDWFD
ncbi:hypothetical protein IW261DRAFT_148261 [Armillaria novae-zelandiae]|uniref:Uncharacterized protein n=1 Tax=Armillaria novae-zelandiae TaxID=153914 RepID=A0AA39P8N5_9AGAR|nr:hypothetical protein IW261DRAFT_148261 [Armillaria novae-zelandiae]